MERIELVEKERILRHQLDKIAKKRAEQALEYELERLRSLIREAGEEPWV